MCKHPHQPQKPESRIKWEFVEAPWDIAHVRTDLPRSTHRYGLISTDRRLTEDECAQYDLRTAA